MNADDFARGQEVNEDEFRVRHGHVQKNDLN